MKPDTVKKWSGYENDIKEMATFNSLHRPLQYFEIAHLCNDPESFKFMNQIRNDKDAWLNKYTNEQQEFIKNELERERISKIKRYIQPCPYIKCKQRKGDELIEMHKREKLKEYCAQLAFECNIEEQKCIRHKNKISKARGVQLQLENKLEEMDEYKRKTVVEKETQLYREMIYFKEKITKAKDLFASLVNELSDNHPQKSFTVASERVLNDAAFDITCNNIAKVNGVQDMTRIIEKINFVPRLNLLDLKLHDASKPIDIPGTFLNISPRNIRNQYKGNVYGCNPGQEQLPYVPKRNHTGVYKFDETGQRRWSCCLNCDIISEGCNDAVTLQPKKTKQRKDGSVYKDLQSVVHGTCATDMKTLESPTFNNNTNQQLEWYPRTENVTAAEWSSTLRNYSRQVDKTLDYDTGVKTGLPTEMIASLSARDSYNFSHVSEKFDSVMNMTSRTKAPLSSIGTISIQSPQSSKGTEVITSPRVKNMKQSLKFMRLSFAQK